MNRSDGGHPYILHGRTLNPTDEWNTRSLWNVQRKAEVFPSFHVCGVGLNLKLRAV